MDFRDQLQELYFHLDGVGGDRRLAYYGQLRATEVPHHEALVKTVDYFRLLGEDWYLARLAGRPDRELVR